MVSRYGSEARVLAALNHPHIAQVYGFEVTGPMCALVMELVPGPTLAEHLSRGDGEFAARTFRPFLARLLHAAGADRIQLDVGFDEHHGTGDGEGVPPRVFHLADLGGDASGEGGAEGEEAGKQKESEAAAGGGGRSGPGRALC